MPKYASDLSGTGAALYGGRWNSVGSFALYTAESSSLSILEHLVHIVGSNPIQYTLSTLEVSGEIQELSVQDLKIDWFDDQLHTRQIGDQWIGSKECGILKVPSAINQLEHNYIINPNHSEVKIRITNQDWYMYDSRLVRR